MSEDSNHIASRRRHKKREPSGSYAARRQEIVKAAADVFQRMGYERTNFNEIAAECGLDRASIYYYYADKEELYRDIVYETSLRNVLMIEEIRDDDLTSRLKLETVISSTLRNYSKFYPYPQVYLRDDVSHMADSRLRDELLQLGQRYEAALRAILTEGTHSGAFALSEDEVPTAAYAILGMLNWSSRWFRPTGSLSPDQISATFARMVTDGIAKP